MKKTFFVLIIIALVFYGCGKDNPIVNGNNDPSDYVKIFNAESGINKFEVYSKSSSNFIYGYNEIGFKVYINNAAQTSGFVKFKPTMYHGINGPSHSVPVPEQYNFDSEKSMFTGYAIFIMYDTSAFWAADFNFNNTMRIDSAIFTLNYSTKTQIVAWDNSILEKTYFLSMIKPDIPRVGLNDLILMLHETDDMFSYSEVNNAEMFIRPWMESMGHGSSNNTHPAMISSGRYKGVVNFNMPGEWYLYDSIKVGGDFITNSPAPKFILQVN